MARRGARRGFIVGGMRGSEPFEFVVPAMDAGARLDVWLAGREQPLSRTRIFRRIEEGEVRVNGAVVTLPRHALAAGDVVRFTPPPPVGIADLPEAIPLRVLFEDEHLAVVDKPAGLVVHPALGHAGGTLLNALLHRWRGEPLSIGGQRRPGIVHRLDKNTSGVLVAAKHDRAFLALRARFDAHDLSRRYLALVDGEIAAAGTFATGHGRSRIDRRRFTCLPERIHGEPVRAVTHWEVRERFAGAALVEIRLETGRTHQIRVHFHEHGHSVIGDPIYGRPSRTPLVRGVAAKLGRQALHASLLGFAHPITGAPIVCASDPPDDVARALAALRDPGRARSG